ncbi:MAG: CBS domain-containing protein [Bacteroidota bacterium]|nr:CBS domain-containing protein [Bacteroidota bacterium]
MKKNTPISAIMTTDLIKLELSDSLSKAEKIFKEKNIRHIPVMEGKKIVGMLSYTDLLKISIGNRFSQAEELVDITISDIFSIERVMTKNLLMIAPDTTIEEAANILANREYYALPVVQNDDLIGILTTTDLIRYLVDLFK